jgi:hypothetical protein
LPLANRTGQIRYHSFLCNPKHTLIIDGTCHCVWDSIVVCYENAKANKAKEKKKGEIRVLGKHEERNGLGHVVGIFTQYGIVYVIQEYLKWGEDLFYLLKKQNLRTGSYVHTG